MIHTQPDYSGLQAAEPSHGHAGGAASGAAKPATTASPPPISPTPDWSAPQPVDEHNPGSWGHPTPEKPDYYAGSPPPPFSAASAGYYNQGGYGQGGYVHPQPLTASDPPPATAAAVVPADPNKASRICGMRRVVFWIVLAVVFIILVVAAVLGGVLGSKKDGSGPDQTTTSTRPTPSVTVVPTAASIPLDDTALSVSTSIQTNITYIVAYQAQANALYYSTGSPDSVDGALPAPLPVGKLFTPKANSPLTSLSYTDSTGFHAHLFYIDESGILSEAIRSSSGTWRAGTLASKSLMPGKNSQLGSTLWILKSQVTLWLYYQDTAGSIIEYGYSTSTGWVSGGTPLLGQALADGTPITLSYDNNATDTINQYQQLAIYAQLANRTIVELMYSEYGTAGWNKPPRNVFTPSSIVEGLSIVTQRDPNGQATRRVLVFVDSESLQALLWRNTTAVGWSATPAPISQEARGNVAAVETTVGQRVVVFFQTLSKAAIQRAAWALDGTWKVSTNGLQ